MANSSKNGELGSISFQAGDQLFSIGEDAETIFFIQSGTVRISKMVASQEVTVGVLSKGEFFGGSALLEQQPRTSKAVALTDVEVLQIDVDRFESMIQSNPNIAMRMIKQLSARLNETQYRLANFTLRSNRGRLMAQLKHEVEVRDPSGENGTPIPTDLAEILGIELIEAKELLSSLVADDLISINEKGYFFIEDPDSFNRYLNYLELRDRFEFRD